MPDERFSHILPTIANCPLFLGLCHLSYKCDKMDLAAKQGKSHLMENHISFVKLFATLKFQSDTSISTVHCKDMGCLNSFSTDTCFIHELDWQIHDKFRVWLHDELMLIVTLGG